MNEKSWMKNHLLRILWAWVITVLSAQFREKVVKCSPQITKPFKSSNHQTLVQRISTLCFFIPPQSHAISIYRFNQTIFIDLFFNFCTLLTQVALIFSI